MKILVGHSYFESHEDIRVRISAWFARVRAQGIHVDPFVLTLDPPGPCLSWGELDWRWKKGDRALFRMYESLARRIGDYDVFVNYNGINLHPEFVRQMPTFKVYSCFDDPESSELLSKPVAWAYDLAMVGNIACVEMYRSWGLKHVEWWPNGFRADEVDPRLNENAIMIGTRTVDVSLVCERVSPWRRERLDRFSAAFPQGRYYGAGWPAGHLAEKERLPLLLTTKIAPNFHNSSGPVNSRTYSMPANGALLLCDNREYLAKIYELGREAVGFDTVDEAIDLCRYYLGHDEERRTIAAAGWRRVHRDYNEVAVFRRLVEIVNRQLLSLNKSPPVPRIHLQTARWRNKLERAKRGIRKRVISFLSRGQHKRP